jgi:hypothetical protein
MQLSGKFCVRRCEKPPEDRSCALLVTPSKNNCFFLCYARSNNQDIVDAPIGIDIIIYLINEKMIISIQGGTD